MKKAWILSLVVSVAILGLSFVPATAGEVDVEKQSIGGMVVGALVGVVIAVALIPVIANQTADLERDTPEDLDTSEETLVGLWPLLIIVGVMMAIIGMAL